MKTKLTLAVLIIWFVMSGCNGTLFNQTASDGQSQNLQPGIAVSKEKFLGYQPIDPIPISKVKIFDKKSNNEMDVFWEEAKKLEE